MGDKRVVVFRVVTSERSNGNEVSSMTCGEIAVFVVTCVTAVLFVLAIIVAYLTVRETKKTTAALRDVQDSVNMQSETIFVSHLWFKWSSPEIRHSINFALRLETHDARTVWGNQYNSNRELADQALEVPRFFDSLIGNLMNIGSIQEVTALKNFAFNADHYWERFEPLITVLRNEDTWGYYRFDYFERFAGKAKEYLVKRNIGDS